MEHIIVLGVATLFSANMNVNILNVEEELLKEDYY